MLVLLGGQERTVAQYATLLHAAGFELAEMVTTSEPQSIIEARPV
jgi:hypothetical protein